MLNLYFIIFNPTGVLLNMTVLMKLYHKKYEYFVNKHNLFGVTIQSLAHSLKNSLNCTKFSNFSYPNSICPDLGLNLLSGS